MVTRSPNNSRYGSTPDLNSAQENNSLRKRKQPDCELMDAITALQKNFTNTMQDMRSDLGSKIDNVSSNIQTVRSDLESYQSIMQKELDNLRLEQTNMKKDIMDLTSEVHDLRQSTQFISDQHEDLKKSVSECSKQSKQLVKNPQYESSVAELEMKIDAMEQQARQCNLEIQNLPEKRNENLINLIVTLGENIRCTISRNDIVSVHRVRHATVSNKPKHIIVKLSSRMLRDNVLAAYRGKRGLTSTELGVPGTEHTLFVNEHLTLRRKKLFRAAREAAKQANYKHKWISNGTILVRASDASPIIAIHTERDIEKIKTCESSTPNAAVAPAGNSESGV